MVASKNGSITNYFKKSAQSLQRKRPFQDDASQESQESPRRTSPLSISSDDRYGRNKNSAFEVPCQPSPQDPRDGKWGESGHPLSSSQHTLPTRTVSTSDSNDHSISDRSQSQLSVSSPVDEGTKSIRQPPLSTPDQAATHNHASGDLHYKVPQAINHEIISKSPAMSSSQPLLTSSQRVVRNGETVIRNSDDESDASLEDIDELLELSRPSGRSPADEGSQLPSPDDEGLQQAKRSTRSTARAREPSQIYPSAEIERPKKFKISLDTLANHKKRDEASENEIARARLMLESYDQRKASTGENRVINANLIESLLTDHGEDDNIGRLKNAIQRTEALQHGKSWSFFDHSAHTLRSCDSSFPTVADERMQRLFGNTITRQQAFLSGYAGEYASKDGLPEEVLLWTMDALCLESRDDLRYSYTSTLSYAASHLAVLLTPDYLDAQFQKLGATRSAIDLQKPVIPHSTFSQRVQTTSHPGLLSFLTLLANVAGDLASESRVHLLCLLCRLALDCSVIKDCHVVSPIGEAFANLVDSIPEAYLIQEVQDVMSSAHHTTQDSTLRLQLLQILPAYSSRLILLRQRLALSFFFQDPHYLNKPDDQIVDLKLIAHHLQTPQFTINPTTDFSDLAASISILSIGLDDGNPPPSSCTKEEEKAFNKDIDVLASKVSGMFKDIVDTGAAQMKRTEAKEVLEGFQRRLEYVVRTKPKPKKLVFGDSAVEPFQGDITTYFDSGKSAPTADYP